MNDKTQYEREAISRAMAFGQRKSEERPDSADYWTDIHDSRPADGMLVVVRVEAGERVTFAAGPWQRHTRSVINHAGLASVITHWLELPEV